MAHAAPGSIEVWIAIGPFVAFSENVPVAGSYSFTARSISAVLPSLAESGTETSEGIESISTHRSATARNPTGAAKSISPAPGGHFPNFCADSSPTAADRSTALAHDVVATKAKISNNRRRGRRLGRTFMMTFLRLSHYRTLNLKVVPLLGWRINPLRRSSRIERLRCRAGVHDVALSRVRMRGGRS